MSDSQLPTRYAPEIPFPAYAFVPRQHPHPITDPRGHSHGQSEQPLTIAPGESIARHAQFRFAIDLFNYGYYWEAHEAWEGFWHALGRQGTRADFLKGLIRLCAAGVKAREGNAAGVIRHSERAMDYFEKTNKPELLKIAETLRNAPPVDSTFTTQGNPVLNVQLQFDWMHDT